MYCPPSKVCWILRSPLRTERAATKLFLLLFTIISINASNIVVTKLKEKRRDICLDFSKRNVCCVFVETLCHFFMRCSWREKTFFQNKSRQEIYIFWTLNARARDNTNKIHINIFQKKHAKSTTRNRIKFFKTLFRFRRLWTEKF